MLKGYLDSSSVGYVIGFVESIFKRKFEMVSDVMNIFVVVFILLFNVIISRVVVFLMKINNKIKVKINDFKMIVIVFFDCIFFVIVLSCCFSEVI